MILMSVSLTDLIDASELLNNKKPADKMSFDRTIHVCECDPNVPECACNRDVFQKQVVGKQDIVKVVFFCVHCHCHCFYLHLWMR